MPLVGTWIEISIILPAVERKEVVPLVGTWIEIYEECYDALSRIVVPLVGTWIEMTVVDTPYENT